MYLDLDVAVGGADPGGDALALREPRDLHGNSSKGPLVLDRVSILGASPGLYLSGAWFSGRTRYDFVLAR